jgi:hypothetical protein
VYITECRDHDGEEQEMEKMRIEARTPEEAFAAFEEIMESGSFPTAAKFEDRLVVKSSREPMRQTFEKDAGFYGGRREMIVDYMTSCDDTMDFFEARGIDIEDELL